MLLNDNEIYFEKMIIGAKILGSDEVEAILPKYKNIRLRIHEFREISARLKKDVMLYDKQWSQKTQLDYYDTQNVISILGKRGSGKTSIIKTVQKELLNKVKETQDIVFPLYEPESIDESNDVLTWIIANLEYLCEKYHKNQKIKKSAIRGNYGCPPAGKTELDKCLEDIKESCVMVGARFKEILQNEFVSKTEYKERYFDALKNDGLLKKRIHAYLDELVNAIKTYKCDEKEDIGSCLKTEPLIHIFFDDIDIETHRVTSIIMTIIGVLNHPNVVVYLSGDYDLLLQKLTVSPLLAEGINTEFLANLKIHNESILDSRKTYAVELLKKALPMQDRYYVESYRYSIKCEFGHSGSKQTKSLLEIFLELIQSKEKFTESMTSDLKKILNFVFSGEPRNLVNVYNQLTELTNELVMDKNYITINAGYEFLKIVIMNHEDFIDTRDYILEILISKDKQFSKRNDYFDEINHALNSRKQYHGIKCVGLIFKIVMLEKIADLFNDNSAEIIENNLRKISRNHINSLNECIAENFEESKQQVNQHLLPYELALDKYFELFKAIDNGINLSKTLDDSKIANWYFNILDIRLPQDENQSNNKALIEHYKNDYKWYEHLVSIVVSQLPKFEYQKYYPEIAYRNIVNYVSYSVDRIKLMQYIDTINSDSMIEIIISLLKTTLARYILIGENLVYFTDEVGILEQHYQIEVNWLKEKYQSILIETNYENRANREAREIIWEQLIQYPVYLHKYNRQKISEITIRLTETEVLIQNGLDNFYELILKIITNSFNNIESGLSQLVDNHERTENTYFLVKFKEEVVEENYKVIDHKFLSRLQEVIEYAKRILEPISLNQINGNKIYIRRIESEIKKINYVNRLLKDSLDNLMTNMKFDEYFQLNREMRACQKRLKINNTLEEWLKLESYGRDIQVIKLTQNNYYDNLECLFIGEFKTKVINVMNYLEERDSCMINELTIRELQIEYQEKAEKIHDYYVSNGNDWNRETAFNVNVNYPVKLSHAIDKRAEYAAYQYIVYLCSALLLRLENNNTWIQFYDAVEQLNDEDENAKNMKRIMKLAIEKTRSSKNMEKLQDGTHAS